MFIIEENSILDENIETPTQDEIKNFASVLKQYVKYEPDSYIAEIIYECEIVREGSMIDFGSNVLNLLEEKIDMICAGINNHEIIIQKKHKRGLCQVSCKDFIGHFVWGEFDIDIVRETKKINKDFFLSMKKMTKIIYDAKQKIKKQIDIANTESNKIITSNTDFNANNSIEFLNKLKQTTKNDINDIVFKYDLKNQNPFFNLIHEFNQANSDNINSSKKILFIEIGCFFLDITLLYPIYQFCKFCFNRKQKISAKENKFNLYTEKNSNVAKIFFLLEVLCVSILIFNIGLIFNILSGIFLLLIIFAMIYQRKKQYHIEIKKYLFKKLCLCAEPIIENHDFLKDRANMLLKTFNAEIDIYIKKLEQMEDKPKGFAKTYHNDNFDTQKDMN